MYIGHGVNEASIADVVTCKADGVKRHENELQPEYPYYTVDKIAPLEWRGRTEPFDAFYVPQLEALSQRKVDEGEAWFQVHISGIPEERYKARKFGDMTFPDMVVGRPVHIDLRMEFPDGDLEQYVLAGESVSECVNGLYELGEIPVAVLMRKGEKHVDSTLVTQCTIADANEGLLVQKRVTHMLSRWLKGATGYGYLGFLSSNIVRRELAGDTVRYVFDKDGLIRGTFELVRNGDKRSLKKVA